MRFTNVFAFVLGFLSIPSIGAPPPPPTSVKHTDVHELDERQLLMGLVVEVVIQVAEDIITDLIHFKPDMHAAQMNFTQHTVSSLNRQFPGKNVLVYHNQKSRCAFSPDAVHVHYELKLPKIGPFSKFTRGYEVWVFDYGTFSLAGDGGFENWATAGCHSGPPKKVVYTRCPTRRQLEV